MSAAIACSSIKCPVILYGIGPHTRVVKAYLESNGCKIYAAVIEAALWQRTAEPDAVSTKLGLPIYTLEDMSDTLAPGDFQALVSVGYVQMNEVRQRVSNRLLDLGFTFMRLVDKTTWQPLNGLMIAPNTIVLDHVTLHPGVNVGTGVFIGSHAMIGHDVDIGPYAWIGAGCLLSGNVRIGERAFLGIGAKVASAVRIGDGAYIGAGAVVTKDVIAGQILLAAEGRNSAVSALRFAALEAQLTHMRKEGD